jgi:hypothetical protein
MRVYRSSILITQAEEFAVAEAVLRSQSIGYTFP